MNDAPKVSKPVWYQSDVTGKRYSYDEFTNHGKDGIYKGFLDLPADEYPYTVIHQEPPKSKWED